MNKNSENTDYRPLMEDALSTIRDLRSELETIEDAQREPVAVIGMGCRFPGDADTPRAFWELLRQGKDTSAEIPASRWDINDYYNSKPGAPGKMYVRNASFLKNPEHFDPGFFRMSPLEAASTDPQQRLLMEVSWEALESAGISPDSLCHSRTGVFTGTFWDDYSALNLYMDTPDQIDAYRMLSSLRGMNAGRIAYLLGVQGPVMQLDTACSSSSLAVHLACQSLRNQECHLALAGGVSLFFSPEHFIGLCHMQALSPDGRCKTFDAEADGFGLGEGCGVVVLKRFSDAVRDRDSILALIKGTAVNHDGPSNGLTAPNGQAQEELLRAALENAAISPDRVQYVETHGTGTELGDPVELSALANVFAKERKEPLIIGSVKTNIGHLTSAAGVASLIKVILSLQNREIPPHLHFTKPNPHIPWDQFSLTVPIVPTPWNTDGDLRVAGVSSFGMTGTNVHLIVEEAPQKEPAEHMIISGKQEPRIFVLSAMNEERLRTYADKMAAFLDDNRNISLADLAYTLQTGRKDMNERLATVVSTSEELKSRLYEYVQGIKHIKDFFHGSVRDTELVSGLLTEGEADKAFLRMITEEKDLARIARLWISGANIDWHSLYPSQQHKRIPLPTYPFAKERFRIEKSVISEQRKNMSMLHPLLQKNTSNLSEQRFSSTFTGSEFFLADHVVQGRKVLPGVAYLEMARAALEQSAGSEFDNNTKITLKNVVWARPIAVEDDPVNVHIGLFPEENGDIAYEIYTQPDAKDTEAVVHSQGTAHVNEAGEIPILDIESLKAECSLKTIIADECYKMFTKAGLEYGAGHRGIKKIYVGKSQALAELEMPGTVSDTAGLYTLHPGLTDSALQASIGLMAESGNIQPALPFALEHLEIFSRCTSSMWAYVRYNKGSSTEDKVIKLDIDLCDETGKVCMRMQGFSSRVYGGEAEATVSLIFKPSWKENIAESKVDPKTYEKHIIILCEPDKPLPANIMKTGNEAELIILESKDESMENRFRNHALRIFEEIQSILKSKPKGKILFQTLIFIDKDQQLYSGLSGLLKTARLENPKLTCQLIETDNIDRIQTIIEENAGQSEDIHIKYKDGKRFVAGYEEIKNLPENPVIAWKDKGVYLITGGAGGLGLIFAKEIARQVQNSVLILTGRSELDADKKARLNKLKETGARIEYKQADVTQKADVISLINDIKKDFGELNGIIHSAGIIKDNFIIKKTKEEFEKVIAPKVTGVINLDDAARDIKLDFFVIFSSSAGALGSIGQADYACANAFMDEYAKYRNSLVKSEKRFGKTLSINWPLWKDGGMKVDKETEKMMMQSFGMIAMRTETGIRALYQGISLNEPQIMIIEGNLPLLRQYISGSETKNRNHTASIDKQFADIELLQEKTEHKLKIIFKEITKVPFKDIDTDEPFEYYGIDSIMITQFNLKLENIFPEVSKTLFYEYKTLKELTKYFISDYPQECINWSGLDKQAASTLKISNNAAHPENKYTELASFKNKVKSVRGRPSRISLPTYPFQQNRYWIDERESSQNEKVFDNNPPKISEVTEASLMEILDAEIVDPDGFDADTPFQYLGLSSLALLSIRQRIQEKFSVDLSWNLFLSENSPGTLVRHIRKKIIRRKDRNVDRSALQIQGNIQSEKDWDTPQIYPHRWYGLPRKNELPIVINITTLRHGSSLTSFMLNAHPRLFAPQGLYLLPYTNLQERKEELKKQPLYLEDGLLITVQHLWKLEKGEAREIVNEWTEQKLPIQEVFQRIQEKCAPRILVDRGTAYGDIRILRRAEKIFQDVKYLHLLRHPFSVLHSGTSMLKKTMMLRNMISEYENEDTDNFLHRHIDDTWGSTHLNTLMFFDEIEKKRRFQFKFEELVSKPQKILDNICGFLEIPFDPSMLTPYNVKDNYELHNKTGDSGIAARDPKLMKKSQIDSTVADNWKKHIPSLDISPVTKYVAGRFGYQLPHRDSYRKIVGNNTLISLNTAEIGFPVFFIPGSGGSVQPFFQIGKAMEGPAFGIELSDFAPMDSFENLAAFFTHFILTKTDRSCCIVGFSSGVNVAWEVANQLSQKAVDIKSLILVDRSPFDTSGIMGIPRHLCEQAKRNPDIIALISIGLEYGLPMAKTEQLWEKLMDKKAEGGDLQALLQDFVQPVIIERKIISEYVRKHLRQREMLKKYQPPDLADEINKYIIWASDTERLEIPNGIHQFVVDGCHHFSIWKTQKLIDVISDILTGRYVKKIY